MWKPIAVETPCDLLVPVGLLVMEEMELKQLIFYNQVSDPVLGFGHKLLHKTVDLQYVLPVS